MFKTYFKWLPILAAFSIIAACGGSSQTTQSKPTEERFKEAMEALAKEDYEKAAELFDLIVTQDPAGDLADDAQFYLAESHFRDESFKLAAFHYNRLLKSFPSSPFYKRALFQTSECYYHTSPSFDRDQTDTENAIKEYKLFRDLYPNDSLTTVSNDRIRELRNKLGHRDYATAEQYYKLEEYESALIYYQRVIDLFADTDFLQTATVGKITALRALDRNKEASDEVQKFIDEHPSSPLLPPIRQLQVELKH